MDNGNRTRNWKRIASGVTLTFKIHPHRHMHKRNHVFITPVSRLYSQIAGRAHETNQYVYIYVSRTILPILG